MSGGKLRGLETDQVTAAEWVLRVRSGSASLTDVQRWIDRVPVRRTLIWGWAVQRYGCGDERLNDSGAGHPRGRNSGDRGKRVDRGSGDSGVTT